MTATQRDGVRRSILIGLLAGVCLLGCGEGAGWSERDEPGGLNGQLTVHLFDLGDHSRIVHTLRLPDGQQRELRFDGQPELASGVGLRVFGADDGRVIQVSRFQVMGGSGAGGVDLEASGRALLDGEKKPDKRWAFVLVDTGSGVNLDKQVAIDRLFSDRPDSIRSYYREVSYGLQELSGDVLGPFQVTPPAGGLCDNFVNVAQTLLPTLDGSYTQYLWYFGSKISNCPWGGVAQLGTAAGPTRHSFYNASSECVVLVQEPGHNFGMVHSSSLRCLRNNVPVSMIASAQEGQCTHNEYGNPFDPMGGGGGAGSQQMLNRCLHMNGVQKAYQDWLGGCNVVKATTSGRFTVYPLEKTCNGVQVLQVPLPGPRTLSFPPSPGSTLKDGVVTSYYVEMRAPVGLDSPLQTPQLFIVAAGELRSAGVRGNPNWLIDTTPETRSVTDAALGVGKTFADPAEGGPKITLISIDGGKAVVQVQLGTSGGGALESPGVGSCSDDRPFTAPGPDECLGNLSTVPANPPADAGAGETDGGSSPVDGGGPAPGGGSIGSGMSSGGSAPIVQGGFFACALTGDAAPARSATGSLAWLLAVVGLGLALARRRR